MEIKHEGMTRNEDLKKKQEDTNKTEYGLTSYISTLVVQGQNVLSPHPLPLLQRCQL